MDSCNNRIRPTLIDNVVFSAGVLGGVGSHIFRAAGSGLLRLNVHEFAALQLGDLLSPCVAMLFPTAGGVGLVEGSLDVSVGELWMRLECASCTSPTLPEVFYWAKTDASQAALNAFVSEDLVPLVASVLDGSSDLTLFGGAQVALGINNVVRGAQGMCLATGPGESPSPLFPEFHSDDSGTLQLPPMKYIMAGTAVFVGIVLLGIILFYSHFKHKKHRRKQTRRLTMRPELVSILAGHDSAASESNPFFVTGAADEQDSERCGRLSGGKSKRPLHEQLLGSRDSLLSRESLLRRESHQASSPEALTRTPPGLMDRSSPEYFEPPSDLSSDQRLALLVGSLSSPDPAAVLTKGDQLFLMELDRGLAFHPAAPRGVRTAVTVLIFTTTIIFAGTNFFEICKVQAYPVIAGDEFNAVPVLIMTLDRAVDMMVETKTFLLSTFLGGPSGILPWVRMALLGFAWLAPTTVLGVRNRRRLLYATEVVGKWGLAQVYFFIVAQVCLTLSMHNSVDAVTFIRPGTLVIYLENVPGSGLLAFIVAHWFSFLLNHAVMWIHDIATATNKDAAGQYWSLDRDAADRDAASPLQECAAEALPVPAPSPDDDGRQVSLAAMLLVSGQRIWRPRDCCCRSRRSIDRSSSGFSGRVAVGLLGALLAVTTVGLCGMEFVGGDLFKFELTGVAGLQVPVMGDGWSTLHEMIESGVHKSQTYDLPRILNRVLHADPGDEFSGFAQFLVAATYVVSVIVAPILLLLATACMLFLPLRLRWGWGLHWVARILFSWSAIEVFCAALLVTMLQMGSFYNKVTYTFCPAYVGDFLAVFGASEAESKCLGMTVSLFPKGVAALTALAVLSAGLHLATMRLFTRALLQRQGKEV